MKKIFTLIAMALFAIGVNAQIQSIASYTVNENSVKAGEDNTSDSGTNCTVQLHGNTVEQKNELWGLKLDSESKYVQIDFEEALQAGDEVNISYFMSSNAQEDNKNGVQLTNAKPSADGYTVLATMYVQMADKKNLVTKAYTAVGGETRFYVYKITEGSSVYFSAVEVKRGSQEQNTSTTWNFTELSATDKANLNADTENWGSQDFDGDSGWKNLKVLAARNVYVGLTANNAKLELTDGLLFARDNSAGLADGQVVIKEGVALNLTGSNDMIKIENLAKDDVVRIKFTSNSATEARGFNVTNAEPASIMSESKTDVKDAELKVTANGDVILKTTKSVNIWAITINAELPVISGIQTVEAAEAANNGAIYNLAGQKVSESYKGVVIKNGKKMVTK